MIAHCSTGLVPNMTRFCEIPLQLCHIPHQALMTEAETVSETLEIHSLLIWLITQEGIITNYSEVTTATKHCNVCVFRLY